MLVDANSSGAAGSGVTGAIQKAARLTGTSFQYLLAAAKVESNLNPNAAAPTSTAGGLFQFIEQTWLGTLKEAGPSLGYGRYAGAIQQTSSGRFVVSDPALRGEIMKLRQDPTANAVMAGAFTKANSALLTQKLGRAPSENELYIAHFLGAGGAAKLIKLAGATPNATAADSFPVAARANRSIFYNSEGRPRSFAQVSQALTVRYDVALAGTAPLANKTSNGTAAPAETARVARVYGDATPSLPQFPAATKAVQSATAPAVTQVAAATNDDAPGMFRNPYRLRGSVRPEMPPPVRAVSRPQETPSPAAPAGDPASAPSPAPSPAAASGSQQPQAAPANEPLGLFQDMKPNVRALFTGV